MTDIFDTIAPERGASATDIFDTLPAEQPAAPGSDIFDKINLTGEPRGQPGDVYRGFQAAGGFGSVPAEVGEQLLTSPAWTGLKEVGRAARMLADVIGGKSITEAGKEHFPESQRLVGVENKPIRERTATAFNELMQLGFATEMGKGLSQAPRVDPTAIAAANEAAAGAIQRQIDAVTPAEGAPSVALDKVVSEFPVTQTQTVPETAGDVFAVPTKEIASRPELMQFKKIEDQATGTNEADRITAPYDPIKAGNLLLWEPINPQEYGLTNEQRYIVANGHHRNEAATGQNVETQNAQILQESAGVSAGDARSIAAETNIADGKGTIYDQAKFIRNDAATHGPDAALERAGQIGARGRKAASIAISATPDLYTSFVNEQITPDAAASIADAAPGNEGLQRLGIQRAAKGDEPAAIYNFIQAAQAHIGDAAPDATQVDLFGSNDVALQAAEQMAKRAGALQKEIGEQIGAVAGAAKRPEKARALGVDVSDPAAVNVKLAQLKELRERARTWAMNTQIRDMAMSNMSPQDAVKSLQSPMMETAGPPAVRDEGVPAPTEPISPEPVAATAGAVAQPEAAAPALESSEVPLLPRVGMRFFHKRVLDPSKMPEKVPQMFEVSSVRQGAAYYRPVHRYEPTGRIEVSKSKDYITLDKWNQVLGREATPEEAKYGSAIPPAETGSKPVSELFAPSETPFNLRGEELTQEPSAEGAARATAEAQYQQGKEQEIFGFGPGAAAVGEMKLRSSSELRQLSEAVADSLKAQGPKAGATQRVNAAAQAAAKVSKGVTPVQRRANTVKAMWQALRNFYVNPTTPSLLRPGSATGSDFVGALKDWQGADQRGSFEVREWIKEVRKRLDPVTDEGITNYIEADGDPALLQQRASAGGKYGPGYEAALKLTPEQINIAENMKQYFAAMLQDGINIGMLEHGVENYIPHLVKQPNKVTNALMADLQSGKLQKNFKHAMRRIFDLHFDLEQEGYEPVTKRASELLAAYDLSFRRALNARVFIKALRDAKAADGEPVTKFSGMTQQVPRGDVPAEAYLIKSRALPKNAIAADGSAYKIIDHPALRGWKFVVQEGAELPAYHQTDMLVHPDHYDHLKNVLAVSKLRTGPLGAVTQPFLKLGALAKQTRLSLSIFHLDQEGLHGLFHRVNPANLDQINFNDPKQWALVRNGLQVADYSAMELFSEGLRGGGLVSKIPGLGELQNRFNEFLFKDYIPRLKMTMATHAFDRNVKRYPTLSPEVIAEMTAKQGNAAFGELNYKLMGRSPTVQDFLRLTLLAPDFLEARSKFVGQALKPYGGEQRMALLLGGATLYVTARVLNQWLDNDPHFELNKAFSVVYNGREYRLRTVMGDVAALMSDPRRFFYNRFSPWLKTGVTIGTQRDYRGIKLNAWEQVKDALSWFVPIPLGQGNEAGGVRQYIEQIPQRILSSGGVENKPAETPIDQTYKAALRFKSTLKDPKIQAEVRRAQQETYAQGDYARLNRALLGNDKERAVAEIIGLMKDKGKTPVDLAKYYDGLPSSPFTGSQQLDMRWRGTMSQPERDLYGKAVTERIGMARLFFQLYRMAAEQYRKEQK